MAAAVTRARYSKSSRPYCNVFSLFAIETPSMVALPIWTRSFQRTVFGSAIIIRPVGTAPGIPGAFVLTFLLVAENILRRTVAPDLPAPLTAFDANGRFR